MTSTDDLIRSLASTAGTRPRGVSHQTALAVTSAAALACALLLVFSVVGIRQDFIDMAVRMPFAFKVLYSCTLVAGAAVVAFYTATPGASSIAWYAMLPAVIFLACGAIFDPTGFPIMGRTDAAVAICVGRILFLSLPAMIFIFIFMRQGAPTQLRLAGAVVGLLSGSVGALAYALACRNDGTAFVAIWYAAACGIMATIGAIVGRRVLRW
jgi:hypothetical protein